MTKTAVEICKKQELWAVIQAVGRLYGEDEAWLRVYGKDVYEANSEDLDTAIACFRSILSTSQWMKDKKMVIT